MPKLKYQPLALATERNGTSSDRHFSPAPGMTTASFVAACDGGGGGGSEIGTLGLSHSPHPLPMLHSMPASSSCASATEFAASIR